MNCGHNGENSFLSKMVLVAMAEESKVQIYDLD